MSEEYYKLFEDANNHFYNNDYDRAKELYEKLYPKKQITTGHIKNLQK